jgi:hypothetical protein
MGKGKFCAFSSLQINLWYTLVWKLTCGRPPASAWPPGWPPDHRPAYREQLNIPNVLVEFAAVEHT